MFRPLRAAVLALVMAGCAMQPVDARSLAPNVPQPLDTRRIEIPLYIVLDPVKLPDAMTAAPAVADGAIFIRTKKQLFKIAVK